MSDPWTWPLSWILRGLALALVTAACYPIARRAGPTSGVTASASGLVLLAVLPFLLLLPGPRWEVPIGSALADLGIDRIAEPAAGDRKAAIAGRAEGLAFDPAPPPDESTSPPPGRRPTLSEARRPGPGADPAPSPPAPIAARTNRQGAWTSGIAVALATLVVIGVSRLALGLGAVARLRSAGQTVRDPSIDTLLDLLRAELSITRPVEVREAPGLGPPATIGWRRPVLLLPDDWRSWEQGELRVVLAHELAHIHRADFPVALLAQLGVALHPWNPMAYWLASRLRLDQELAADATAARLSGGRRPYLACLARLALRRDDLASGWAARAFLPVRGTLVRRIEMLRCERSPDRDGPSRAFRGVTIASITGLALLCAGLRAPETAEARPQGDPAPEAAPLGDDGFDLSPVPADATLVAAIRPARLATHPEIRDLIDEFDPLGDLLGGIDLRVPGLQQVTVVELRSLEARVRGGPTLVVPDLIILRTVDPVGDELIGSILEDAEAVSYLGTRYHRARGASRSALRFDDRTLILAQKEQAIRNVIAGRDRPGGTPLWRDAADRVDDGQILLAFETTWLSQLLGPDGTRGDLMPFGLAAMSGPMFDRASAYAISLDLLDGMSIGGVALCVDEEGAARVSETATALKTLARNALGNIRGAANDDPELESVLAVKSEVETLLGAAIIEAEGSTVRLQAESDQDLGAFLALATGPINAARIADRRSQATNNLKRIGLALHNYHDINDSFPPPILFSEDGFPYSWRVAILPFLEQTEGPALFESYHFDEPWDGPNNRALLERMPDVFRVPGADSEPTHADYFALVGERTLMGEPGKGTKFAEIRDGSSYTFMIVESKRAVPWTRPEDIPFEIDLSDPNAPAPELGGFWPNGFQVVFGDGSVRFISRTIDPTVLKALCTRDGGELFSSDRY
ncbi:M56 family metallopeptidase [Tautonia plasticadhaerens]|uniref:Regulatory protein BlaR1 n=1 Tax=Tautonia plasticadhaerens TaxID=2527974 RepID=A0A518GX71_9BACT|nr:M56 family metallopeptidase [Tautonia plasticadhaerens]QDV33194.1 Regulatory protein BlaR1 [Tautonia plasticadhaerens]